jgi:hypothetical protein
LGTDTPVSELRVLVAFEQGKLYLLGSYRERHPRVSSVLAVRTGMQ